MRRYRRSRWRPFQAAPAVRSTPNGSQTIVRAEAQRHVAAVRHSVDRRLCGYGQTPGLQGAAPPGQLIQQSDRRLFEMRKIREILALLPDAKELGHADVYGFRHRRHLKLD